MEKPRKLQNKALLCRLNSKLLFSVAKKIAATRWQCTIDIQQHVPMPAPTSKCTKNERLPALKPSNGFRSTLLSYFLLITSGSCIKHKYLLFKVRQLLLPVFHSLAELQLITLGMSVLSQNNRG